MLQSQKKSQPADLENQFEQLIDKISTDMETANRQTLDDYNATVRNAKEALEAAHRTAIRDGLNVNQITTPAQRAEFIKQAELKFNSEMDVAKILREQSYANAYVNFNELKNNALAEFKAEKAALLNNRPM